VGILLDYKQSYLTLVAWLEASVAGNCRLLLEETEMMQIQPETVAEFKMNWRTRPRLGMRQKKRQAKD
jgi:hypothetical protein